MRLNRWEVGIHTRTEKCIAFSCRMCDVLVAIHSFLTQRNSEIICEINKTLCKMLKSTSKLFFPLYFLILRLWVYRCDWKWKLKSITTCPLWKNTVRFFKKICYYMVRVSAITFLIEHLGWAASDTYKREFSVMHKTPYHFSSTYFPCDWNGHLEH